MAERVDSLNRQSPDRAIEQTLAGLRQVRPCVCKGNLVLLGALDEMQVRLEQLHVRLQDGSSQTTPEFCEALRYFWQQFSVGCGAFPPDPPSLSDPVAAEMVSLVGPGTPFAVSLDIERVCGCRRSSWFSTLLSFVKEQEI